MMDDLALRLGANVRYLRESRGLSLAQVSARSGIAKSTLSQIEAGKTNPTLATLHSLAGAFFIDAHDLMTPSAETSGTIVRRAGTGSDESGAASIAELLRSIAVGPSVVEFHHVVLHVGSHETSTSHGAGSREHVLMVSGMVELGPDGDTVVAVAGDYISYPGDVVHRFRSIGDEPAVYWIVATYPRRMGE